MTSASLPRPVRWQVHAPAALVFAGSVLACAVVAWLTGSARLLAPFIASAGVIAAAAADQRPMVIRHAVAAYGFCAVLGLLAHAGLPRGVPAQSAVAVFGFVGLRLLRIPHPPALALLMVLGLSGASMAEWPGLAGLVAAMAAGSFAGHRWARLAY